jgi:indole-3-glycerol phosphate synthase
LEAVLNDILKQKRRELDEASRIFPLSVLKAFCLEMPRPRDFHLAMRRATRPKLIFKLGSQIADYDLAGIGADALLTSSLADLPTLKNTVQIPVIMSDFIIDEYQVYRSRRAGADSFVLSAAILDIAMLQYLIEVGRELEMEPLIEVHSAEQLGVVLKTDAKIVCISDRDPFTRQWISSHASQLLKSLPRRDRIFVCDVASESQTDMDTGWEVGFSTFITNKFGEAIGHE